MAQAWLFGVLALLLIGRGLRASALGVVEGQGFSISRAEAPRLFAILLGFHATLAVALLGFAGAALIAGRG